MKYIITFMKRSGKVKGRVGCNSKDTALYIVKTWQDTPEKKGLCIVLNTETKEEKLYSK